MATLRDNIYDRLSAAGVGVGVAPELADELAALVDAEAVKPLREAVEFLIALACYYCRSGYGGVCKPPCAKCTALDAFRALLDKAGA